MHKPIEVTVYGVTFCFPAPVRGETTRKLPDGTIRDLADLPEHVIARHMRDILRAKLRNPKTRHKVIEDMYNGIWESKDSLVPLPASHPSRLPRILQPVVAPRNFVCSYTREKCHYGWCSLKRCWLVEAD